MISCRISYQFVEQKPASVQKSIHPEINRRQPGASGSAIGHYEKWKKAASKSAFFSSESAAEEKGIRTMGYARSGSALIEAVERGIRYGRKTGEIALNPAKQFMLKKMDE